MNEKDIGELIQSLRRRIVLYKRTLKRRMRRFADLRGSRPKPYQLVLEDRMALGRYNPEFMVYPSMPKGQKVLVVLPHPCEAAKIGGMVRVLLAPEANNTVQVVVVLPSHRGVDLKKVQTRREDLIDAARHEGLDWSYLIGLNLGIRTRNESLPPGEIWNLRPKPGEYDPKRDGDQFAYGPDGAYRFFNAWRTYDTGEPDRNKQRVVPWDQDGFAAMVAAANPDIVLVPDFLDPHPSQRTTREMAMESLRRLLAARHARGDKAEITLLECPSFQLLTPPRYNLWVMAPKAITSMKNLANRAFRQKAHLNYPATQIMAEGVVTTRAIDECQYLVTRGERPDLVRLLNNPQEELTAESYTASRLFVDTTGRQPIVRERRLDFVLQHFSALPIRTAPEPTAF